MSQIVWPWTYYYAFKATELEEDHSRGRLWLIALFFWLTLPKIQARPPVNRMVDIESRIQRKEESR